jgi:hypothetical protein
MGNPSQAIRVSGSGGGYPQLSKPISNTEKLPLSVSAERLVSLVRVVQLANAVALGTSPVVKALVDFDAAMDDVR